MNKPLVSIIVETITTRFDCANGSLADDLGRTLNALDRQTYPQESIETIVVLDSEITDHDVEELGRRYPTVRFVWSPHSNYFAAKNAGTAAAKGDFIALLDGDCEPAPNWVETLMSRLQPGVDAVGGCTRYAGRSWTARTFSIPDFAYVLSGDDNTASGFNINNVVFRRDVLLSYPFDTRISRNGGCYFLFHQLLVNGARVLYEPGAVVSHGLDIQGFGFVRKHFDRGYDGVTVYRLDSNEVLRGTRLFRRFGALALVGINVRRIGLDWMRLVRHRRQIGISLVSLPYFWTIAVVTRLIELSGGMAAIFTSTFSKQES